MLGVSRVLKVASPLWSKMPKVVAAALPAVAVLLPQVADAFGVVKTEMDLVSACVFAVALLVPGVEAAVKEAK